MRVVGRYVDSIHPELVPFLYNASETGAGKDCVVIAADYDPVLGLLIGS
ncbi:MAG TPA: hypothetical protein VE244_12285 [Nitrososphaeraceae archaeon]|jgi:hypothetical protein|nr:hypothetical protein [Nitrososphaeraceae archaeon]